MVIFLFSCIVKQIFREDTGVDMFNRVSYHFPQNFSVNVFKLLNINTSFTCFVSTEFFKQFIFFIKGRGKI